MPVIAGRTVSPNDSGVLAGGTAVLVFSFFTWFSSPLDIVAVGGWNSGLFSFLAVLLSVAASVVVALRVFPAVSLPRLQWGWSFLVLAAAAAATALLLLKLLIGYSGWDRGFGLYLALLGAAAQTAFAWFAFQLSGETLPGGRRP